MSLEPQLLLADDGTLTAAWIAVRGDKDTGDFRGVIVRTRPPGGTWTPEQVIAPGARETLDIALDADDQLVATYLGRPRDAAYAITQAADGTFGDPVPLAPQLPGHPEGFGEGPFLSVGDHGQQTVVWIHNTLGGTRRLAAVRRRHRRCLVEATVPHLARRQASRSRRRRCAPDGSAGVLWTVQPRPVRVKFRMLTTAGRWTPAELVTRHDFAEQLQLVNLGGGRVTALWVNLTNSFPEPVLLGFPHPDREVDPRHHDRRPEALRAVGAHPHQQRAHHRRRVELEAPEGRRPPVRASRRVSPGAGRDRSAEPVARWGPTAPRSTQTARCASHGSKTPT